MFCRRCESFFNEDDVDFIEEKETGACYAYCPHCGSEDIEDSYKCSCGEDIREDEMFCDECKQIVTDGLNDIKDALKIRGFVQDDFEEIIIDHFGW